MKQLRWGVISVSTHYRLRVHEQVAGSETCKVVAIASRDKDKADAEADRLGIPLAFGSYEALLESPDIDAVYLPLPNHLHAEWVRKAADAGKHVLCEKPFAMDAAEAALTIDYAASRGVKVMEAFMYKFHPQWTTAKRIIRSGELGRIVSIHTQFAFNNKDPKNIRNIPEAGGGAIMDIGCYAVSSARFLLGAEPRRVLSRVERDPAFGTDILSSALLDFGGAHAAFSVSTQAFASQHVDVLGTSGSLSVILPFNMYGDVPAELRVATGIGSRTISCGPAEQYRLMFEAFSRSAAEGLPEPCPPEDAVANMKVLDALLLSEKTGTWANVG